MEATSTSSKASIFLALILFTGLASADYYYSDGPSGTQFEIEDHEEILLEYVAPFLFIFALLQFTLKKALEYTFATDDDPVPMDDGPDVGKEATVMALAISLMMVASPYWTWIQTTAAGIGLIAMLGLVLLIFFIGYLFARA